MRFPYWELPLLLRGFKCEISGAVSTKQRRIMEIMTQLVGGFNRIEKYWSKWESSPNRYENNNFLKPQPSQLLGMVWEGYGNRGPTIEGPWRNPYVSIYLYIDIKNNYPMGSIYDISIHQKLNGTESQRTPKEG